MATQFLLDFWNILVRIVSIMSRDWKIFFKQIDQLNTFILLII
jgi:hypothetical protein